MNRLLSTKVQERIVPKSLLLKQAIRMGKIQLPKQSQLIASSMRDIKAMFQPSATSQEDDDMEIQICKRNLQKRIEDGELKEILIKEFKLNTVDMSLQTSKLVSNFAALKLDDLELLNEAMRSEQDKDWSQLPLYSKQLKYFIAYGSYGPRRAIPFNIPSSGSTIPKDYSFKYPVKYTKDIHDTVYKLLPNELTDLRDVYEAQTNHDINSTVGPITIFIILSAIGVSIVANINDILVKENDEAITVVR